jgi:hypothetical protein
MGQFKPMVKMETTEPSVILKLKSGGHVNMKKGGSTSHGHKAMCKADGGIMDALAGTPSLVGRPAMAAPVQKIGKPSMSARRKAMMAKPAMPMAPVMKEGGKADTAEDKAMVKKAFKQHDAQEHKGGKGPKLSLKKGGKMATGGVVLGNGGGYKTGGVVLGNGGGYKTGGVVLGNGGGYKAGGKASKKAYATGGTVNNSGRAVAMPQGSKKPPSPVSISKLAGTYKKGGRATPAERREESAFNSENATAMRQSKADSNLKYRDGGAAMDAPFGTFEDEDSGSAGMGNNGLPISEGSISEGEARRMARMPMKAGRAAEANRIRQSLSRSDAYEGALKSTPKAVISERKKVTVVPREAKVTTGAGGYGVTGTPEEIERALSKVDERGYPLKP